MFYSFSWFSKPELLVAAKKLVVAWAKDGHLAVPNMTEARRPFDIRTLSTEELAALGQWSHEAWRGNGFGGFNTRKDLAEVNGFCYFNLSADGREARLSGLYTLLELSDLPLHRSPQLHLAVLALIQEAPDLERIFLPFEKIGDEDQWFLDLMMLDNSPEPGRWNVLRNQRKFDLLSFMQTSLTRESWIEISFEADPGLVSLIDRLFSHFSLRSRTVIEYEGREEPGGKLEPDELLPAIVKGFLPNDPAGQVSLRKIQQYLFNLNQVYPAGELEIADDRNLGWDGSIERFKTKRIGRRFVVSIDLDHFSPQPDDIVIRLKPFTRAFGPNSLGIHATTSVSLQLLEMFLNPAQHRKMLDLGTGSGTLSIAAAKMGAERILALEADETSIPVAIANFEENGVADRLTVEHGSLAVITTPDSKIYNFSAGNLQVPPVLAEWLPFDLIVANTINEVVIAMAPHFYEALRPGGLVITSGVTKMREAEVNEALERAGLVLAGRVEEAGWVGLAHTKPPS